MGKRHPGLAIVIGVVLLGAASTVASAQSDDSVADAPGAMSPGAPTDASALEAHRALRLHGYDTTGALHITLPPPARTPESASSGGDGPLQVSFERGMPAEYEGNLSSRMKWVPMEDGTAATQASVTSPGATNMRMGVQVDLPPDAEIRFSGADPTTTYPVVTREDISWKGFEPQTLWSPIVEGQTIGIEIVLPSEESLSNFRFEIDGVLHGFLENGGFGFTPQICSNQVDAMCRTSRFESFQIGTVAQISYRTDSGGGYVCSGTMMNDKDQRHFIPYFLTANHCISSQTEARSIVAQWYYLPATCGGTTLHSRYFRTSFGANMLETSLRQDSSFLVFRYRARKPQSYSGWNPARAPIRHDAFGLHHPSGTRMKYSAGRTTRFKNVDVCDDLEARIGCNLVANAIEVDWTDGLTEGGSSGSGLFFRLPQGQRLMGVLSGGRGGCTDKISSYGNFRDFYGQVRPYLNATTAPISAPPFEDDDPIDDDHGNNCSDATRVSVPSTTGGSLERGRDVDAFRFSVSRAGELRVETTGSTDTLGRLYRGTSEIGRDDDGGDRLNFRITADVQPGDHCVEVRGYSSRTTGGYSLRVGLSASPPPPPPANTRFGDFNGNGRDDVLVRHTSGRWYYYAMNGRNPIRGTSGGARLNSDTSWRLAGIGDFNGDGRDDVLVRHTSGRWYYYAMNGRNPIRGTSGGARLNSDTSWRLAGIGDFNGDGRDDVLVRHTSGRWYYYAMNGRNPIRGTSGGARLNSDTSWRLAGIGDFNGDGRDDVLVRHTSGRWYYYAMNGRNPIRGTSGGARLNSDTSWRLAGIGDFNGDGRDDVLVRHTSGRWYYYAMNGRNPIRGTSGGAHLNSDTSWRLAGTGDLNGDGRDDVLVRHTSGRWYYYAMNGRNPIRGTSGGARLNSDTRWAIPHSGEPQQSAGESTHVLPLLTASSNEFQRGIVRIINHSERSGTVAIHGVDGAGTWYGPATLTLEAKESVHLDSAELEDGSPSKGLLGGLGDGTGNWRLKLTTELDIEPLAYVRNVHGAFTPLHEIARTTVEDSGQAVHHVPLFPSAGDGGHDSQLRLINLGDAVVAATIGGVDDAGNPATDTVRLTIPGGQTRTLTPQDLETPGPDLEDVRGGLGDGEGNWRLSVAADGDIAVMSLLLGSDTVANLSASRTSGSSHDVPYVPASNGSREGYVRIINHSDESGDITVSGIDDAGYRAGPVTLSMEPGGSVHLSSSDLASGNSSKGLSAGLGDEGTTWRLVLHSELETEPFAHVRSTDGFLRPMHAFVRTTLNKQGETEHHVPFLTPANSGSSQGLLRVTNMGESSADVTIAGRDDAGTATTTENRVVLTLPAGATRTLTAQELESGDDDFTGRLGDGDGNWQLTVTTSSISVQVLSLSRNAGELINLSSSTRH